MTTAADGIGWALARVAGLASQFSATSRHSSREHILRIVQSASAPMSLEEIVQQTGLHSNTVRTHLDVLRAAGLVDRVRSSSGGRGRPRWLYRATDGADPYTQLAQELTAALESSDSPDLAARAARLWQNARHVHPEAAGSPDEAVAAVGQALDQLGFHVDISPVGDAVFLGGCPYAALIADNPIICDIHAQAIRQMLEATGQDVSLASVDVFPRSGVCLARLQRPEVTPQRVVGLQEPRQDKHRAPEPRRKR